MRKPLFLATVLGLLAICGLAAHAHYGSLTASDAVFTPNSSGEINTTTGYMGTATWSLDNTNAGLTHFYLCYEVDVYVYDEESEYYGWNVYQVGYVKSACGNGNYAGSVDFTADLTTGIPDGTYNVAFWITTIGTDNVVGTILTSGGDGDNTNAMVQSSGVYKIDPLPDPEPAPGPDPGDNPPVVYPILPPSGPSGPGSITVNPATCPPG